jgi:hypothetical protein
MGVFSIDSDKDVVFTTSDKKLEVNSYHFQASLLLEMYDENNYEMINFENVTRALRKSFNGAMNSTLARLAPKMYFNISIYHIHELAYDDDQTRLVDVSFNVTARSNDFDAPLNDSMYQTAISTLQQLTETDSFNEELHQYKGLTSIFVHKDSLLVYDGVSVVQIVVTKHESPSILFMLLGDWGKGGNKYDIRNKSYTTSQLHAVVDGVSINDKRGGDGGHQGGPEEGDPKGGGQDHHDDMGKKKTEYTYQAAVAEQMAIYAVNKSIQGIVALGDNFYEDGVYSTTDTLWTTMFKDVYFKYKSLQNISWFPVFGNHDYGYGATGVQAQLDRYRKQDTDDDVWIFPSTNYTKRFYSQDRQCSVQIIFVDTTTLAPNENRCCNEEGYDSLLTCYCLPVSVTITTFITNQSNSLLLSFTEASRSQNRSNASIISYSILKAC